jgi:hypothetical protein
MEPRFIFHQIEVYWCQNRIEEGSSKRRISSARNRACMKQLLIMAIAVGVLAVTSVQQSYAQYDVGGTGASEATLQRCAELDIPRAQCNDVTVLQAERFQLALNSEEKGSGTSMVATELGQMVLVIGVLGTIFGGVAGAFYGMGRKAKQVPA